jgi:dipeptide/tripeptide permease
VRHALASVIFCNILRSYCIGNIVNAVFSARSLNNGTHPTTPCSRNKTAFFSDCCVAASPVGSFIGLFLIAVGTPRLPQCFYVTSCAGTGGIKPCVSSFGGDQFSRTQEKMLRLFFSVFYFAINAGRCDP